MRYIFGKRFGLSNVDFGLLIILPIYAFLEEKKNADPATKSRYGYGGRIAHSDANLSDDLETVYLVE